MSLPKVLLVVLATVVIFAAGVITGAQVMRKRALPTAPTPFMNRFETAHRAVDVLDLEPAQRVRLHRIIRDHQELMGDYFRILEPDMQGVFARMRKHMHAELTPDQRQRLEEVMKQRLRRNLENKAGEGFRPGQGQNFPNPEGRKRMFNPNERAPFPQRQNGQRSLPPERTDGSPAPDRDATQEQR